MDRITAIQVFLAVTETGSFTQAAARLDISKPMISRYVNLMEDWLNARLLQRTTRKVSLTEAGEQAVVFCRQIINLQQEMEQELAAQSGELRGGLRLTASNAFGSAHLVQAINAFMMCHPKLNIQLLLSDTPINLVEERIDLAVRITNSPDPNLVARKLAACHSVWAAPPAYLAQAGEPATPDQLANHRYLAHANINRKSWKFKQNGREIQIELTSRFATNDTLALLHAVQGHGGIAMLPRYLISEQLKNGTLKPVLTDWQLPEFDIYALYPSRHKLPLAVRSLIDFLAQWFAVKDW